MTGGMEGFFWVCEIFDSGILLGRTIWQVFFGWLDLVLRIKYTQNFNAFRKFLRLENSAWDFLGVISWPRDFFGF